jgi:hypothetical protein
MPTASKPQPPVVTPSSPVAQPAIASYAILGAIFDFGLGTMVLRIQAQDAQGNLLGTPQTYPVGNPVASARITVLSPQVASDYATDSGN